MSDKEKMREKRENRIKHKRKERIKRDMRYR